MNERSTRLPEIPFTSADDSRRDATVFTCPLCGGRFTHGNQACGSCPIATGCDIVRCPHCNYGFPRSSQLVNWVERWIERIRRRR